MSLELIIGPMFGGKTTEILRRIGVFCNLSTKSENKALFINHTNDTRTQDSFSSHNPLLKKSTIDFCTSVKISSLSEIDYLSREHKEFDISQYQLIAVDEAQFFDDLVENVKYWISLGKTVIVSGLNGDFHQKKFGFVIDLIPFADSLDFFYPWCINCYETQNIKQRASFSKRIINTDDQILIGEKDAYVASCRKCLK